MKGYVIDGDGNPLVYGERTPGSKVAELAAEPGNAFVSDSDDQAAALAEAMQPVRVPKLRKLAIVDRMTDEELAAALAFFETPEGIRPRERWNAATEVDTTNEQTRTMFVALYGESRTSELLAPE